MVKVSDITVRSLTESVYLVEDDSLPAITSEGVSRFIKLPAVWPILKRVLAKAIPVTGTGLSLYDAWNEVLKGDWVDASINLGLAGLSIGQLFGYAAGGAPGVALTTVEIAGALYVIRGVLIRLYFEQIEGIDLSNYSDEDLEDYTDELIAELAKQLAEMLTDGIYDAAFGASEEAASMETTVPEYDAMGNVTRITTVPPTSPSTGEPLPPLPALPEKPEVPKLSPEVIKAKANELISSGATPAVLLNASPMPAQGLNFKGVPFKDAWTDARELAKKLDPENPGVYGFTWNGKQYQTNAKGEPNLPVAKRRKLIDISGGTLAEDLIGKIARWFGSAGDEAADVAGDVTRGADDAAGVAGDAASAADEVGAVLKPGQTPEDAEEIATELDNAIKSGNTVIAGILNDATNIVTLDGVKYAKYYDPMRDTWKWVDLQKAEAGGKRSSGFVDDAMSTQLDDALSAEARAADDAARAADDATTPPAGAADDAARAADDATTPPAGAADDAARAADDATTPPASAADDAARAADDATPPAGAADDVVTPPRAITLTDEARTLLRNKPVDSWTVAELRSLGYTADDVQILSIAQKLGDDIAKTPDEIIKSPFWRNWSRATGVTTVTSKLPTKGQLAWGFLIYGGPVFNAVYETWNLDPNDPNYQRRLLEIWTACAAEVGLLVAGSYIGGAIAAKVFNNRFIRIGQKWPWVNTVAKVLGAGGGYYAASQWAVPNVEALVNKISDTIAGEIPRDRVRNQGGSGPGGALQQGETPDHSSDSLYDRAYRHAKSVGMSDVAAARTAAKTVEYGPESSWAQGLNENMTNVFALAWLHNLLTETADPVKIVKIHKNIKKVLERFNNKTHAETFALQLIESKVFQEEQTDNFMNNITAAIAANTKGDKMGAQKALDAAKQSQPATAQDQINQKKVLDQMARTNPGLNIPNTNQNSTQSNVEEAGGIGGGMSGGTIHGQSDGNAANNDLLAAYNEFAAKYPAAKFLLDIVPVTGTATSVIDASQHLSNGQYSQAALDILGAIPGFKIAKYLSRGLANTIKAANTASKTANYANATSDYANNANMYESPKVGDRMMLELADGRIVVAPIAELRGNGIVLELDETGSQWLEESPEHHTLKIGQGDGHPLSTTAEIWNAMVDQLPTDTPDGWAEVFIKMQNQTGQPARVMPRLWSQIWRQQHNNLGDSLTRVDMTNWAEEVGRALDRSGLVESSLNPTSRVKLQKYLDPKDPAMLAVWMASRAGTKGIPVDKFAKAKAVQSGLPADHWWRKIKKLVQEGAVPTVPRLLAARDIEPLVHFEGDYYIVSHNDGKHLKYDLVKKVVATTDRNIPAYQHVDHLDTGLYRITKEQLRRLANVAMEADKLADGETDTPDLPDLLGVIAQVMGRKVRKHPDALSTTVKKSDVGYVVSNLLVRHLDGTEAQDLKNALHRAGYNVSKVIINPTTILVILKTTKTTPNITAMITATPQPDVVGGLTEGRRDFNFDENDIARIAAMDDLDAAKQYAIKLITAKTRRPMTKEKIMWFTNSINDTRSINRLVKMLYDMMLSGEGHGVIGDRYSTSKSSYRRQFDEESQRLDPKCWKGYRKQGTKIKGGVRVNNCVKVNENMDEDEEELYYEAIDAMDNLYYALTEKKFVEAANRLSQLGRLYQEDGVYLSNAIDMITNRIVKMHIKKLHGLLNSNKDAVIRGILQMIKNYGVDNNEIDNLNSVLEDFGVEWPELDAVSNAVAKSLGSSNIAEAEYKGKSVPLNKPIRTSPSEGGKFKVYVKDPKTGNIKMVRFGDTTGLTIKRDDPERRRNFRARHNCDNPGPKTKARYWSCKMWTRKPVGQVLKGK